MGKRGQNESSIKSRLCQFAEQGRLPAELRGFRSCVALRKVKAPGVGTVDVLLVGSKGDVGVVEAKLSGSPESNATVVHQLMAYLWSLAATPGNVWWEELINRDGRRKIEGLSRRLKESVFFRTRNDGSVRRMSRKRLYGFIAVGFPKPEDGKLAELKRAIRAANAYLKAHKKNMPLVAILWISPHSVKLI